LNAVSNEAKAELSQIISEKGQRVGSSVVVSEQDALKALTLLNEIDGLDHAAYIATEPNLVRNWRDNMRNWYHESYITGDTKGRAEARPTAMFGEGSEINPQYGGHWTPEKTQAVVDQMRSLPTSLGPPNLVLLSPLYSLSVGGNYYGDRGKTGFDLITINANMANHAEDAKNAITHEIGHGVQRRMLGEIQATVGEGRHLDTGDLFRQKYDETVTSNAGRRDSFRIDQGNGRSWGGTNELFAEDVAHAYGAPGHALGNEHYGNVAPMDQDSAARFRRWVEGRA
jgi:hypothetical protein